MKKFKILPQVNPESYKINQKLDNKNYELTDESQAMRKKVELILKNAKMLKNC
ncbi:MAG: hypothetical protein MUF45_05750 [Spirosomaceae bacterium]|jgi:hypothetical protein|nr:hypothetical protein [Spirosomataceae bacterium]